MFYMLVVNFSKKKNDDGNKGNTLDRKYPRKQNEIRNRNERIKNLDCNTNND